MVEKREYNDSRKNIEMYKEQLREEEKRRGEEEYDKKWNEYLKNLSKLEDKAYEKREEWRGYYSVLNNDDSMDYDWEYIDKYEEFNEEGLKKIEEELAELNDEVDRRMTEYYDSPYLRKLSMSLRNCTC